LKQNIERFEVTGEKKIFLRNPVRVSYY